MIGKELSSSNADFALRTIGVPTFKKYQIELAETYFEKYFVSNSKMSILLRFDHAHLCASSAWLAYSILLSGLAGQSLHFETVCPIKYFYM